MLGSNNIPQNYRWNIWKLLINIDEFYAPNLYERFTYLRSYYEQDIKKDVNRSFPKEVYFGSPKYDLIGQRQLFNVLKAISLCLPNVGYC